MVVGHAVTPSRLVIGGSNSVFRLRLHPRRLTSAILVYNSPRHISLVTSRFSSVRYGISDHRFRAVANDCGKHEVATLSRKVNYSGVSVMMARLSTLTGVGLTAHRRGRRRGALALVHVNASNNLRRSSPINSCMMSRGSVKFSKLLGCCSIPRKIFSLRLRRTFHHRAG